MRTIHVAPLTSTSKPYPSRIPTTFGERPGFLAIDQMRAVDKSRILRHVGRLPQSEAEQACRFLRELFVYEGED